MDLIRTVRDTDISPMARRTLDDALAALRPHSGQPTIGAAIEKLKAVADDSGDTRLETALTDMSRLRVELRSSAAVNPQVRERVENAYRDISHEYLLRHSEGYASTAGRAVRNAEAGLA